MQVQRDWNSKPGRARLRLQLQQTLLMQLVYWPTDLITVVVQYADPVPRLVASIENGDLLRPSRVVADSKHGSWFITDWYFNRVRVVNWQGEFVRQWGSTGDSNGEFIRPSGIAFDPKFDWVYVIDSGNNRVQVFSSTGTFEHSWKCAGAVAIALNPHSSAVYISTFSSVLVFTPHGDFIRQFDPFIYVTGLTVQTGTNFVFAVAWDGVHVFDCQGNKVRAWQVKPTKTGRFQPDGIVLDQGSPGGFVYLSGSSSTHHVVVQVFTPTGEFVGQWHRKRVINPPRFLTGLVDIAHDERRGLFYLADRNRQQLLIWSG